MTLHSARQLVLLGAELAHVHLLAHLRQHPLPGVQVTLITPKPRLIYRAMLAGFVAGRHALEDCTVTLEPLIQPLAAQGRARWLTARAAAIDASASTLRLDDGQAVKFDWLSINNEPLQDREALQRALPGAQEHGLFVHPVDSFCALWPRVPELAATRALRVAVIGGTTTAGIELALAIRQRLPSSAVTLITGGAPLGQGEPPRLQKCLADALRQRNVTVLADSAVQILAGEILLGSGARLASDVPVIATGTHPPAWLAGSGLATNSQGLIAVDANAQSTSHPHVFATGQTEAGSRFASPHSTQAQAARLAAHLVTHLTGQISGQMAGQMAGLSAAQNAEVTGAGDQIRQRGLQLISCGDGQAVAAWGNYATQGRWAGWLKQRLDRAAMARYREFKG